MLKQKLYDLDSYLFFKTFKKVGDARLQLRKIDELILFKKIDASLIALAKKNSTTLDDVYLYTFEELVTLVNEGKRVPLATIRRRAKGYVYWKKDWKETMHTGVLFKKYAVHIRDAIVQQSGATLTGRGVSSGVVRAPVQLILHKNDDLSGSVRSFKKGHILVTEMTRPQLLTVCRKAKGIITDEGGLLSHAAIISRELGIPCIVGVKVATKVLKNDDVVELDAERGVVHILHHGTKSMY